MATPALKLVREHPLAGVATVSIVGRRVSINEVPWIYRVILRWVFRRVNWASTPDDCNHSKEIQMVATDPTLARANMKPGWYVHDDIPVNVLLPEETCKMGKMEFMGSPMNREYARIPVDTVSVKISDLNRLTEGLSTRVDALSKTARS